MLSEYCNRISERFRLADLVVAFDKTAIPCARRRAPLSNQKARKRCAWGMNDKVREEPWPGPNMEKQINENLGTVDRQVDNLSQNRVRSRRVLLCINIGKQKPHQAKRIPANFQRIVSAGLN